MFTSEVVVIAMCSCQRVLVSRGCRLVFIGVFLAAVGSGRPASAYRTAADLADFAGAGQVRWFDDTIHYEIDAHTPSGSDTSTVEDAVGAAFATWMAPSCTAVDFAYDGTTGASAWLGDGTVTVQWVTQNWTGLGYDPSAGATTDILYELDAAGRWRITDADIYLNAELFHWTVDSPSADARDLQAVVTHEVGHALGLLHPCEIDGSAGAPVCSDADTNATMYPIYVGIEQRSLASDDEAGVCYLYAPAECVTAGCTDGRVCTYEGCVVYCGDVECRADERCGPDGCTDEPCAVGSCELGCEATCASSGGEQGGPCTSGLECLSGYCSSQRGYCTRRCDGDSVCPENATCDEGADPAECVPNQSVFGEACLYGDDCLSGLCLEGATPAPMCTRECGAGLASCPVGYACTAVEGSQVCSVPPSGTWCSVAVGLPKEEPLLICLTLLLAAAVVYKGRIAR